MCEKLWTLPSGQIGGGKIATAVVGQQFIGLTCVAKLQWLEIKLGIGEADVRLTSITSCSVGTVEYAHLALLLRTIPRRVESVDTLADSHGYQTRSTTGCRRCF